MTNENSESSDNTIDDTNSKIYNTDPETDDEEYEIITYKNKKYILENEELFEINEDETKGTLFGTFKNGKVKKIHKNIEV